MVAEASPLLLSTFMFAVFLVYGGLPYSADAALGTRNGHTIWFEEPCPKGGRKNEEQRKPSRDSYAGLVDGSNGNVIVVTAPVETQVARLIADRWMNESEARARIAAQAPGAVKEDLADVIVPNDGSPEELEPVVEALWRDLQARAPSTQTPGEIAPG
jgi:hypothetical protein